MAFVARHWVEKNLTDADLKDNQNREVQFFAGTSVLYVDTSGTPIQASGNAILIALSTGSSGFTAGQITNSSVLADNPDSELVFMHGSTAYVIDEGAGNPIQFNGTAITVALKAQ